MARSIAFTCLLTAVVSAQGGTDPVRLYNEAQSRESTLRVELAAASADPRAALATRRRLRTLVGAYRDLARLFPTSGIADKALWQAAMLAGDTYTTWGDPTDKSAALRAFESLSGSFPNSSLARQVPAQTRRLWEVHVRAVEPPAGTATATAATAATPAPAPAYSPVPPAPGAREVQTSAAPGPTPTPVREATTSPERQAASVPPVPKPALRPPASAPATTKTPTAAVAVAAAAPANIPVVPAVAEAPTAPAVTLASLTAITHERVNGAVRITLQVDRETAFVSDSLAGPPRVFVDLKNTRMLERLRDAVIPVTDPVVQRIRVGRQPGNLTRVVLDLTEGHRYSAFSMYDPYRIVIDVDVPDAKTSTAAETLAPPVTTAAAPKAASPAVLAAHTVPAAAHTETVDDAPPLAPGVAASIGGSGGLVAQKSLPESWASGLVVAHRTTVMERRMQAKATPARLYAGDTTAAVNATIAARSADSAEDGAPTADAPTAHAPAASRRVAAPEPPAGGPSAAAPTTASKTARGDYSLSRQLGLGVARVVIDAGHGGHDPGAMVKGLTEAGLVLDIAQRLEVLLRKQPGVDVIMTRRSDTFVALEERTEIANRAGADLFVSIHANASVNPRTRGVETYVLNFATSPEAESIAARENSGSSRTMRNLPDIVKTIATNNKVDESRELGRFVQTSLHNQLRKGDPTLRNLGVKQAPFMVLVGATMPAILSEVAFVTNLDDANHMRNEKYRQDVAEALLAGITRYQQSLKHNTAPAVTAQAAP